MSLEVLLALARAPVNPLVKNAASCRAHRVRWKPWEQGQRTPHRGNTWFEGAMF
jgi:hypothetical protein